MPTKLGEFSTDYIVPLINGLGKVILVDDNNKSYSFHLSSAKFLAFKNSLSCYLCGLTGNIFVLEKDENQNNGSVFLSLYHRTIVGNDIMMTLDHVIPKSKNGQALGSNGRTACFYCNLAKGSLHVDVAVSLLNFVKSNFHKSNNELYKSNIFEKLKLNKSRVFKKSTIRRIIGSIIESTKALGTVIDDNTKTGDIVSANCTICAEPTVSVFTKNKEIFCHNCKQTKTL